MWRVCGHPNSELVLPVGDMDSLKSVVWKDLSRIVPGIATDLGYTPPRAIDASQWVQMTEEEQATGLQDLLLAELGRVAALPHSTRGISLRLITQDMGFNALTRAILLAVILEKHVQRGIQFIRVVGAFRKKAAPALVVTFLNHGAMLVDPYTGHWTSVLARAAPGRPINVRLTPDNLADLEWPQHTQVFCGPLHDVLLYELLTAFQAALWVVKAAVKLKVAEIEPTEFVQTVLRPNFPSMQQIIPP